MVVLRDLPIVGFVKYLKDPSYFTTLTLQGIFDLYLYGYESHLAELVILLIGCIQKHEFNIRVLLLIASQFRDYFFRIPYFTSYLY